MLILISVNPDVAELCLSGRFGDSEGDSSGVVNSERLKWDYPLVTDAVASVDSELLLVLEIAVGRDTHAEKQIRVASDRADIGFKKLLGRQNPFLLTRTPVPTASERAVTAVRHIGLGRANNRSPALCHTSCRLQ